MKIAKKINKKTSFQIISTTIGSVFLISGIIFAVILVMQPQLINGNAQVINTSYNTIAIKCGDGCGDYPIIGGSWCRDKAKFCCPAGTGYIVGIGCVSCRAKSECSLTNSLTCVNYKEYGGKTSSYWKRCVEIGSYNGCPNIKVYKNVLSCLGTPNCICGMPPKP